MGQKNIIELNGKKYDALSGELLGESRVKATSVSRANLQRHGRVIDGFVKTKHSAQPAPTIISPRALQPAPKAAQTATKSTVVSKQVKNMDIRRVSPKSAIKPHQPERPKTLMRHFVKKPDITIKPAIKTVNPSEIMAVPKGTIAKPLEKKVSVSNVNPFRLARSRHISKSHHIRRFYESKHAVLAAVPALLNTQRPAQYATRSVRSDSHAAPQTIVVQQPGVATVATQTVQRQPAKTTDIFEAALAHATSHEQKTPAHARHRTSRQRRFINIMAGIGAFLLIAGFTAYMNMPGIELRVASMRAGFHAEMPGYHPTGYALDGGVESSDGRVAMNFRSGNSLYTVTQQASDWNSETLLDQTASERGEPTQTIQSKGRTIYIYDDSNATWVNGGVHYQVTGNAPLNADELVSLATSM